jgi:hypothetical protein
MKPWLATIAALAVAVAFFAFALVWKGWILFALICFGLWYGYGWLKLYWPEAAEFVRSFGRGFLRGFFGRR